MTVFRGPPKKPSGSARVQHRAARHGRDAHVLQALVDLAANTPDFTDRDPLDQRVLFPGIQGRQIANTIPFGILFLATWFASLAKVFVGANHAHGESSPPADFVPDLLADFREIPKPRHPQKALVD